MIRHLLITLMFLVAIPGVAAAAGPDLDLSQPPDPQPPGGPIGDGEDWTGDGRAPVIEDDEPGPANNASSAGSATRAPASSTNATADDKKAESKRKKGPSTH